MRKILVLLALSFNLVSVGSENLNKFDHSHTLLNEVLKENVKPGKVSSLVNYKALKKNPTKLNNYLKGLETVKKDQFSNFSQEQKLSFWINAYNAFTIKLVVQNYPVKSIKDIKHYDKKESSWFSRLNPGASPWKIKFIKLLGKKHSLDNIEHGIIRKDFSEPRIHFAVNCASMGCPSLGNEAFNAANLETLLDKTAKSFVNNTEKNSFDTSKKVFKASRIFKWYGSDFDKKYGSFVGFIKKIKPELGNLEEYKISWNEYGWNLNEFK